MCLTQLFTIFRISGALQMATQEYFGGFTNGKNTFDDFNCEGL